MKAIYQTPETFVASFATEQLMAASPYGENFKPGEEPINLEDLKETGESSGNLSRRSVWDDEEDEEF